MKNLFKTLDKSVSVWLRLIAATSTTDAGIHKNVMIGDGIIKTESEEIDIMKIDKNGVDKK